MNTANKTIQQLIIENITQNIEFSMFGNSFFMSQCIHLNHILLTEDTINMIPDIKKIKNVKKVSHLKHVKSIHIYNKSETSLPIITLFY